MRTAGGGQLSTEAALALKLSFSLACRRNHVHVTPLHVASTLLVSSPFKTAFLFKSQNNPFLQCQALELCFKVALDRLPTAPSPLCHQPSLSNSLVAALKRAHTHQRRGASTEHLLALKVEVDQLILSILDDPSVGRVMCEAGFSSVEVKKNIKENFNSLSSPSFFDCYPSPTPHHHVPRNLNFWENPSWKQKMETPAHDSKDIKLILEVLSKKKKKNAVIVGDNVSTPENLVLEIMNRIEKGDDIVPEELKKTHFIRFQFSSVPLRYMKKEEVELNMLQLKGKVDTILEKGKRVIIYTGDLNWTLVDKRETNGFGYNSVEHLVDNIGKMISDYNSNSNDNDNDDDNNSRVWLMGSANYQTYMRCKMKKPSLEAQWCLQPVSVPISAELGLSLHLTSVQDSRVALSQNSSQVELDTKKICNKEGNDKLTCCDECTSKYGKEAANLINKNLDKSSTQLPFWLQPHTTDVHKDDLVELRRKWNKLCYSQHEAVPIHNNTNYPVFFDRIISNDKSYTYPYPNPSCPHPNNSPESNSISFARSYLKPIHTPSSYPCFRRQQSCQMEFSFDNDDHKHHILKPNLDSFRNTEGKEVKTTLALGSSLTSNTAKLVEYKNEMLEKLKANVPWQFQTIPLIIEALVEEYESGKKENWLLIEGNDFVGKWRLANGIAESVFGSTDFLLHMNMKESENERNLFCETLGNALKHHDNLVVFVENIDFADTKFLQFLGGEFKGGIFSARCRKEGKCGQKIFILAKNDFACYGDGNDSNSTISDSGNKRKAEWDSPNKAKNPKSREKENASNTESTSTEKVSSANTLDLNIIAEEEDEENEYEGEISKTSTRFLEMINNRFVFNRDATQDSM